MLSLEESPFVSLASISHFPRQNTDYKARAATDMNRAAARHGLPMIQWRVHRVKVESS